MSQRELHDLSRTRRLFLRDGSLLMLAGATGIGFQGRLEAALETTSPDDAVARFALITDLHYADKETAGTRHYRETPAKLAQAAKQFANAKPDFLAALGDLIDAADDVPTELGYLQQISNELDKIQLPKHYVLGNHCVDTLTKREFLDGVGQEKSYYSFDQGGVHFVVLDACFRSDGVPYQRKNFEWTDPNIEKREVDWLKQDLANTDKKTVVFVHQRLDVTGPYGIKNAAEVRKVLEDSGNVLAVFQGHSHENEHQLIGGIHYCTLVAMVEGAFQASNGFSVASVFADGTIRLSGFRQQSSYNWPGQ
ncbi:MAG: metallophosphoesterase [Mariniblastus sp.]|nr:metallophosphoesterase [Mariniblastus sp.]